MWFTISYFIPQTCTLNIELTFLSDCAIFVEEGPKLTGTKHDCFEAFLFPVN